MKMNSAQIEQTLQQFKAQAIPGGHPVMPADWDNRAEKNNLEPHPPEVTDLVIDLEVDLPH